MDYSIVIPTFNRARSLRDALFSVAGQTFSPSRYEIIIVDDGSTDGTVDAVLEFKAKHPEHTIRYFYQENGGPAKARNRGIKEARGEYIFFADDDCEVPPNWMEVLLDGFKRYPEAVGVGGWYEAVKKDSYFSEYNDAWIDFLYPNLRNEEILTNVFSANHSGNTANMAYRRKILERYGGFDENLSFPGQVDWELKKRIQQDGAYLLYIPLFVNHKKKLTFLSFFKQFFNRGRGGAYIAKKFGEFSRNEYYFYNKKWRHAFIEAILWARRAPKFMPASFIENVAYVIGGYFLRMYMRGLSPTRIADSRKNIERRIIKKKTDEQIKRFTYFNKFSTPHPSLSKNNDFYSIVLPTYNRSVLLAEALKHLANQTLPPSHYEIIVVNDGSVDNTADVAREFQKNHPSHTIRYFYQENGGPAKARNRGIKEARGEYVFFTDDDCEVPPNWMEVLLDGFKRYPEAVGVGGWLYHDDSITSKNVFARYFQFRSFFKRSNKWALYSECFSNDPSMVGTIFAYNTGNLCIKKRALEKVGCFREEFPLPAAEDMDLGYRILKKRLPLLYLPFHPAHKKNVGLLDFVRIYFNRGIGHYVFGTVNSRTTPKVDISAAFYQKTGFFIKLLTLLHYVSWELGVLYAKKKFHDI